MVTNARKVKNIPLQVFLSERESLELTKFCEQAEYSKSQVVREALKAFFRQQTASPTSENSESVRA